jgi:hypothetical protein
VQTGHGNRFMSALSATISGLLSQRQFAPVTLENLPREISNEKREVPVKSGTQIQRSSAIMRKSKKPAKKPQKALDTFSKKRLGRPGVRVGFVVNAANHYKLLFDKYWPLIGNDLVAAKSEQEVLSALLRMDENARNYFDPFPKLILEILTERDFPKRQDARIRFLADSLGARGAVSPRRSRDICEKDRNTVRHKIYRQDFYIGCTCGYEGPANRGACPKCGSTWVLIGADRDQGS